MGHSSAGATAASSEKLAGTERVLFVDDERAICQFASTALNRLGYRASTFQCPLKALDVFREAPHEFDVVVTDELMPGLRGSELLFNLREVRPDIPVILYSGFSEAIRGVSQDELPFNAFVTKPMVISELTRAIRESVGAGNATG